MLLIWSLPIIRFGPVPPTLYACHGSSLSFSAISSSSSGSGCACRRNGFGGETPPRVTDERNPSRCRPRTRLTCIFETGIDVRPRRALEAFCRCEHTCARFTSDMMAVSMRRLPSRGCNGAEKGSTSGAIDDRSLRHQMSVSVVMQTGRCAAIACAGVDGYSSVNFSESRLPVRRRSLDPFLPPLAAGACHGSNNRGRFENQYHPHLHNGSSSLACSCSDASIYSLDLLS